MKKILVYGWYHQENIGDDLFMRAFRKMFPNYHFVFHNEVEANFLQDVDAVFFGGGSFLLDRPRITDKALKIIKTKKIFYLGIGVEAEVHPVHLDLMKRACLIAIRSLEQMDRVSQINPNVMLIPDLVYSLQSEVIVRDKRDPNAVLILPNVSVLPTTSDPYWKHASWVHFKSEFAQFADWLVDNGHTPFFYSSCRSAELDDSWVANEIVGHMSHRNKLYLLSNQPTGIMQATSLISRFGVVVTQRFHGIILSEMTRTPYIAIHHHDKIKNARPSEGKFLSYYNVSKQSLISAFRETMEMKFSSTLPIESNIFEKLSLKVMGLVENGSLCRS